MFGDRMGDRAGNQSGGRGNLAEAPHYLGHRARLRERFREAGAEALPDYELLEMVLYGAFPRGDTKPLAKELIRRFGSFAEVMAAPESRLAEVPGVGESAITASKVVHAAAARLRHVELRDRPVLSSWSAVLDYCRTAMDFAEKKQLRIPLLIPNMPCEEQDRAEVVYDAASPSDTPRPNRVQSFGPKMVCAKCGVIGADARPNWKEKPGMPKDWTGHRVGSL
jgi:hypothetical protein